MGMRVAVVGATGNVGREMLSILAERKFPVSDVHAVASERSVGTEVSFGENDLLKVRDLDTYDFKGVDIALFSPGAKVSALHAPRAAKAGAVVIDNTSQFRMDKDVPLVVPEVNPQALAQYDKRGIIANPNCSTIQMVVALKPLHDRARIKRVVVSTYQSVSGAGREAMDELFTQTRGIYVNDAVKPERFTKQIAFNFIPHIDIFMDDGSTKEEWKMVAETSKILDPDIKVTATCVRVPVFIGHAEAVNVEFERPISASEAREALRAAPGVQVIDHRADEGYVTPVEAAGEDAVYRQPHPQRPDGAARAQSLGRRRQSAQGRRTQRGADRRASGARPSIGGEPAPALRRLNQRLAPPARPRRSVLFVPGSNARALEKARGLAADVLVFDLEDAVAPAAKPAARAAIAAALGQGGYGRRELALRVNGLATQWGRDDLVAAAKLPLDAVMLPKVESAEAVRRAERMLDDAGAPPRLALWCMLETPLGILHAEAIAAASPRIAALVMGTADLAKDLRAGETRDRLPLLTALGIGLLAARAYGLAALDGIHADLGDDAGFEAACRQGRALGFDGKSLIHPKTIATANHIFAPAAQDLLWARRVIAAHAEAVAAGSGVTLLDGKLIERLHVEEARRTVALSDAIAALEQS